MADRLRAGALAAAAGLLLGIVYTAVADDGRVRCRAVGDGEVGEPWPDRRTSADGLSDC